MAAPVLPARAGTLHHGMIPSPQSFQTHGDFYRAMLLSAGEMRLGRGCCLSPQRFTVV